MTSCLILYFDEDEFKIMFVFTILIERDPSNFGQKEFQSLRYFVPGLKASGKGVSDLGQSLFLFFVFVKKSGGRWRFVLRDALHFG